MIIKSAFAAVAALSLSAGAAVAGPYVNVEANSDFRGSDYEGTVTETHVGYEDALGENAGWHIQAGPAFVSEDGQPTETELSGEIGLDIDVTDNIEIYTEVSFITDQDDFDYGTKVGVTYRF